ncbi:MAG: DUF2478 domain-containing protein [Pseudomonadota bacterium]
MQISYTVAPGRGDTDRLLYQIAQSLMSEGLRPAGIVQINTERPDNGLCDMDVKVLPEGPVIRISQTLGRGARGCRLDPDALETSVAAVDATLSEGADCLIVNKFGKHEADGRGFRPLIAEALTRDLPVLVGLNRLNEPAFSTFTDGMAIELPPEREALVAWLRNAVKAGQPTV